MLAILLPTVLFGAVAQYRYNQVWAEQQDRLDRLTRIVTEHALKLFDTNRVMLDRMEDLVAGKSDAEIRAHQSDYAKRLRGMVARLPQVQSVWILDARGHPLLTNRYDPAPATLDLSDRESFRYHAGGGHSTFITGALIGKLTRDEFFDLTRRRDTASGAFAGTVQISLYPKYLDEFYRELADADRNVAISIMRDDGALIARWPHVSIGARLTRRSSLRALMGDGKTAGITRLTSTLDGVPRMVAFRKVGDYPVFAAAGIAEDAVRGIWLREISLLASFVFPVVAGLALFGWLALRRTRDQLQLANHLIGESEKRQRVEQALLQAQKTEALGHLTGGVAHDFNNLLMVVGMNAHLLKLANPALKDDARIKAIERATAHGTKLTRQLLSFTRHQPLMPATIRLQDALPPIIELCAPMLGRAVDPVLDIAPDTPPITVDTAEFELALINLAVNARHAMPEPGTLTVRTRRVVGESSTIEVDISVSDTGCGIAPEHLPRVLEPFYTTRPAGQGTGLGLAQVSAMCARAGGRVSIASTLGRGTTVTMRLPAANAPPTTARGGEDVTDMLLSLRVLLVEDNDEIATATTLALHAGDCTVHRCARADEAMEWLGKHREAVDIVLSDVSMPGSIDGIGLVRHVKDRYPALPIALMTGYAQHIAEAERLGVPVLPKPFGLPALRELLARVHGGATGQTAAPTTE